MQKAVGSLIARFKRRCVQKNVRFAVHFQVASGGLVVVIAHAQLTGFLAGVGFKQFFAHPAHARAAFAAQQAVGIFGYALFIEQAHNRKNGLQAVDFLIGFLEGNLGAYSAIHHKTVHSLPPAPAGWPTPHEKQCLYCLGQSGCKPLSWESEPSRNV